MPYMVNGIGTTLVRASRKRTTEGFVQFDAIEALVIFLLPVIPYKVVHVLNSRGTQYQSMRLKFSGRIVLKAFLRQWSFGLLALGGLFGLIFGLVAMSDRGIGPSDQVPLIVAGSMIVTGAVAWTAWTLLERSDNRLRKLFGATPAGTSDPLTWLPQVAEPIEQALLEESGTTTLPQAADRLHRQGHINKAAVAARLAQAQGEGIAVQELLEKMLRTVP